MKKLNKRRAIGVFSVIIFLMFFIFSSSSQGMQVYQETGFTTGIVTAKTLNVRQGPGLKYKVVTHVSRNEYVRVFAQIGNWYIIQTDKDYIGAVSKDYIKAIYAESNEANKEEQVNELISEEENSDTQKSEELQETKKIENSEGSSTAEDDKSVEKVEENVNTENAENTESTENAEDTGQEVLLTDIEKEVFDTINQKRKDAGVSELKADEDIQNIARVKAKEMEEKGYFAHTSPTYGSILEMLDRFSINYKVAGENIAGNSLASGAIDAWMNSDSHKANILSNGYNYTGVGVANSSKYGKIYVQIFVGR